MDLRLADIAKNTTVLPAGRAIASHVYNLNQGYYKREPELKLIAFKVSLLRFFMKAYSALERLAVRQLLKALPHHTTLLREGTPNSCNNMSIKK